MSMTEASFSPENNQQIPKQRGFDILMNLNREAVFKEPKIIGLENLQKIPIEKPLIIATSHFSDVDIQVVESSLHPKLKEIRPNHTIGISIQSHNLIDPFVAPFIKLIGRENFFAYDVHYDKKNNHLQFLFNPENFKKMAKELQNKKDIITAAHEPLSNIKDAPWELPKRSGLGAAYLAQLTTATILPVAVDIQSDRPVGMASNMKETIKRFATGKRPSVNVVVGEPFTLRKIDNEFLHSFEVYSARVNEPNWELNNKVISPEEKTKAKTALREIRKQSDMIMKKIAALLPEKKRGRWITDNELLS